MVPEEGIEPTRPFGQGILSPLRLPFRHSGMLSKRVLITLVQMRVIANKYRVIMRYPCSEYDLFNAHPCRLLPPAQDAYKAYIKHTNFVFVETAKKAHISVLRFHSRPIYRVRGFF